MSRSLYFLLAAVGLMLLAGQDVGAAQPPAEDHAVKVGVGEFHGPVETATVVAGPGEATAVATDNALSPGDYYLGIQCLPILPALRSQLNLPEGQGYVVGVVAVGSPAAAAGIERHDVLLRVGDQPLDNPRRLHEAIQAAQGGKLTLEILRGGKPQAIEVTPAKRPNDAGRVAWRPAGGQQSSPAPADWQAVQQWFGSVAPGQSATSVSGPMTFRFFHPGAIVSKDVFVQRALPADVSVTVTREGDRPAQIRARRGEEKWELTEKELDKLPAELRSCVEPMLGRPATGIVGAVRKFELPTPPADVLFYRPMAGTMVAPGPIDRRIEERLDAMNRRIEKILEAMEKMSAARADAPAPAEKPPSE